MTDFADPSPLDILPLSVGFAVVYLDGALVDEHSEVKRMGQTVREHLLSEATGQSDAGPSRTREALRG